MAQIASMLGSGAPPSTSTSTWANRTASCPSWVRRSRERAMDEFLAVAEVAEILKLNQQTVRNRIDQPTPSRPRARAQR
jgi:hypothetical protein